MKFHSNAEWPPPKEPTMSHITYTTRTGLYCLTRTRHGVVVSREYSPSLRKLLA